MNIEKFERQKTPEELLERYDAEFSDKQDISLEDLSEMKEKGISTEMLLDFLGSKYGYIFHGSRNDIPFSEQIESSNGGKVFASKSPAIAILKALYRNNAQNLGYPLNLAEDNSNLILIVDGPQADTVGERGYVYVIPNTDAFKKSPDSNWQYSSETGTKFLKRIQVEKNDFKYPMEIRLGSGA